MAGLMAALLLAPLGLAPAAAAPACPDDPVSLVQFEAGKAQAHQTTLSGVEAVGRTAVEAGSGVDDAAVQASAAPAGDVCPDGCVACGHCQSHHTAIGAPAGSAAEALRFAHAERRGHFGATAPLSHLRERLKRPPRA